MTASSITTDHDTATQAIPAHQQVVARKLPTWVSTAEPAIHQRMRAAIMSPPAWFIQAWPQNPQTARALANDYALHREYQAKLAQLLKPLPKLEAFAQQTLTPAVKQRFGLDLDVSKTYLLNASKAVEYKQSLDGDPIVDGQRALKMATQSLLRSAMQNFEKAEAQPGGMDRDSMKAVILDDDAFVFTCATGKPVPIAPDQFADLSRQLDIGGEYQKLIDAAYTQSAQDLLKNAIQSAFRVHVHLAFLQDHISKAMYDALLVLSVSNHVLYQGEPLHCNFMTLWERQLNGALIIGVPPYRDVVVSYLPGAPTPLKQYSSIKALLADLPQQFLTYEWSRLKRLIPARYVDELTRKLQDRLLPIKLNREKGEFEAVPDPTAELRVGIHYFDQPLLDEMVRQKMAGLKDDAAFHAVPTALEDEMTAQKRKAYFIQLAFDALNVGAFFVPGLGAVMMGVTVLQLGFEIFDGLESWANDDREQALSYMMDVAENMALIGALGATGNIGGRPAVEPIPVETPSFIEELKPVEMPYGETRLWYPDLAPFAHDIVLPAGLVPDELGLYHYQGKTWLALEDKVYSVSQTAQNSEFRLEHPSASNRYSPLVRHNGAGTWLHELDKPLEWQGHTLIRRLGQRGATISATNAQRILWVSGTSEAVMRGMFNDNLHPPALLEDTLRRFTLDEQVMADLPTADASTRAAQFQTRYQTLMADTQDTVQVINRAYPNLPSGIAEEVVTHANADELQQLKTGKVPLRLSEEIRLYQQQVRLQRAYEGLYLESVRNPETDILILHTLERLPGWSPQVRIEVREGWQGGRLLDSIGPDDAVIHKVLTRRGYDYAAFDIDGKSLHGHDDLYSAVLHALPDSQRASLGFPGTWDGPLLKSRIQQGPLLPRPALRKALNMQPARAGRPSPMRLSDGRIGYPLSGRGAISGYILRDNLLDMMSWLELPSETQSAQQILGELEARGLTRQQIHARLGQLLDERSAIEAHLTAWGQESSTLADHQRRGPSRSRIHQAIWQNWFDNNLPEIGRTDTPLRLEQILLIDFPAQLPEFFMQRVQRLQLIDIEVSGLSNGAQFMADEQTFERFCEHFPQLVALEIGRITPTSTSRPLHSRLLHRMADWFPRLRELRLPNYVLPLMRSDADALRNLPELEHLDLSGGHILALMETDLFHGMSLRFLGLDRMNLYTWPEWLGDETVASLQHLSLRNNQLPGVPERLLNDSTMAPPQTLISLHGNPLSTRTVMRARFRDHSSGGRYTFDIEVPPALQNIIDEQARQRTVLREALDSWASTSSSSPPLSERTSRARSLIGDQLLAHLHALQLGETYAPLVLDGIELAEFPPHLPGDYFTQIQSLQLARVTCTAEQLERFLSPFQALYALTLEAFSEPLQRIPNIVTVLPNLRQFRLYDQGMLVDQQAISTFASMHSLDSLHLDGNRIGEINDVSALSGRLNLLSLANTGLQAWPEWVEELLPISLLNLNHNQITVLPDHILYNPNNNEGQTEISLYGNPLSEDTMYRAHTSERYGRSYTFNMDLPDSIANNTGHEPHSSDSASESGSDSDGHVHSPPQPFPQDAPDVERWLLGSVEENQAHRDTWHALVAADDARDLLALIGRLTESAPYRTRSSRADFAARVWHVLEIAAGSAEQRQLFNVIAQEAVQTCPDGAWLLFNQMEIRLFTEQALRDIPAQSRGPALYRLTLRLYRLHTLDEIARTQTGSRDEAEVRLAYRLRLAQQLDLPLPPSSMLFQSVASLRRGELDEALAQVQQGEHGDPFILYAASRDFWVDYLKEANAERFATLEQDYQDRVLAVTDQHPGETIEQLQPVYDRLEQAYRQNRAGLVRELTLAASHANV